MSKQNTYIFMNNIFPTAMKKSFSQPFHSFSSLILFILCLSFLARYCNYSNLSTQFLFFLFYITLRTKAYFTNTKRCLFPTQYNFFKKTLLQQKTLSHMNQVILYQIDFQTIIAIISIGPLHLIQLWKKYYTSLL